jgi:hypothetical protein
MARKTRRVVARSSRNGRPTRWRRPRLRTLVGVVVLAAWASGAAGAEASGSPIRFVDATIAARLTSSTSSDDPLKGSYIHAAAWGDVNGDGWPDLYLGMFTDTKVSYYQVRGASGPAPNRLLLNHRDGTFSLASGQVATSLMGRTSGSVFVDLNNDGRLDLVVSENNYGSGASADAASMTNHLYRNDGNGKLTDVTAGSGIDPSGLMVGRSIGVLDYDHDGCLDLYIVSDEFHDNTGSSRLLKGDCAFHFADVTAAAGLEAAQSDTVQGLGVGIGDVDGDGWPDIFVAGGPAGNERRNFLFLNQHDGKFHEVTGGTAFNEPACTADPEEDWTSGVTLADLNHDGRLDVVLNHHYGSSDFGTVGDTACAIGPTAFLNTGTSDGVPQFTNVSASSGIVGMKSKAPHAEVVDLDNDGCPDIVVSVVVTTPEGTGPFVYRCTGITDGTPKYASPSYDPATLHYYPAGALADYNRDGRPDIFMGEYDPSEVPSLYKNVSQSGHWLDVRVSAPDNRFGIGAKVFVYPRGQSGNVDALLVMSEIQVGNGFSTAGEAVAHIGLGRAKAVDVVVKLPFAAGTRTRTVKRVDRTIRI